MQYGPEYDLAVRLRRIEDLVAKLASNQIGQAFSATQSDGSLGMSVTQNTSGSGATTTVWYQGPNTSRDPNTGQHPALLYIGQVMSGGVIGASAVLGFYPSGATSLTVGASGVGVLDTLGNVVLTPDSTSGEGLARPHLSLPTPQATDSTKWITTTAGSWTEIATSVPEMQQPKIRWDGEGTGTGDVQLLVKDFNTGATLASSQVWSPGGGAFIWTETFALPAGLFGKKVLLSVQAQATAGTSVSYVTRALYNVQS